MKPTGYLIEPDWTHQGTGPMFVPADSDLATQAREQGWNVNPVFTMPALSCQGQERLAMAEKLAERVLVDLNGEQPSAWLLQRAAAVLVDGMDAYDRGEAIEW